MAYRMFSFYVMIDDADGTIASWVILASEKLLLIIATFADYQWLFADRATGTLFDEDECFSRNPA
jgi:hypothetical protein